MNFDFSDDQRMLREHARRYLSEVSDFHSLRTLVAAGQAYSPQMWQQMVELGWLGVALPEEFGGLGLGLLEVCVLAEELGRTLAPVPFFSTVCLGAEILKTCPSGRSGEVLAAILEGRQLLTVQLVTPDQHWNEDALLFQDGIATGVTAPLQFAQQADIAIVPALRSGAPVLVMLELNQVGVKRHALKALDGTVPYGRLNIHNAKATLLASGPEAVGCMKQVVHQAAILMAFEQLGGAEAALEMARTYALERHTFGRPIGSYQAVKHKLAHMAVKLELARSNAYYGAWALQAGTKDQLAAAAAAARLSATQAYAYCAEECLHLHGGIGYTWEANCHFYYKRARLLAVSLGSEGAWVNLLLADASRRALFA